jgi:hypothetical protein
MVDLSSIINGVALKYRDKFIKNFYPVVLSILKTEYYPLVVDKVVENFKLLPTGPSDDPTALENWGDEFKNHLIGDAENAFSLKGNELEIGIGDKGYLGIGQENNTDSPAPIVWLAYFIADTAAQGIAGRFAFLSKSNYESSRGEGSYKERWGRFGEGFMISKEDYESEGWENTLGPFEANEHPLSKFLGSGEGPINIFQKAVDDQEQEEQDLAYFISKAVEKTLKSVR